MSTRKLQPREQTDLMRRLSKTPLFDLAGRFDLARLLAQAERLSFDTPHQVCQKGDPADYFYVLLDGDYRIDGEAHVDLGKLGGGILGLNTAAVSPSEPEPNHRATVYSVTPCAYLQIPASAARDLYCHSPPFRGALVPLLATIPGEKSVPPDDCGGGAVVRFESSIPETPLSFLIELLAREITAEFPDRVVIVRRKGAGFQQAPTELPSEGPGTLYMVEADDAWLTQHHREYDYVLLDEVEYRDFHIKVRLMVGLVPEPLEPPAPRHPWELRTVVVQPAPLPCARHLRVQPANHHGLSSASTCRVHLSFDALSRLRHNFGPEARLSTLDPRLRESLGVWARALTFRRTGLAIGGGGVFAMTSIHVLRRLRAAKVPIDVLTGSSGGALVGSFYAAKGLPGLQDAVDQGTCGALDAMVLAGAILGSAEDAYLRCVLGDRCVEHLRNVEFYPAMSDVSGGRGVVATHGPLALAVRASGSTPPIFGGTITNDLRLVDGAFTNNLPVQALSLFGADLTFGLNVYPPSRLPLMGCVPTSVQRLLSSFSVVNRTLTFVSAFNLLASVAGTIEGDFATISFNAVSRFGLPYLTMPNFLLSARLVRAAEVDEELNAKIDCYISAWQKLQSRGKRPRVDAPER